MDRQEAVQTLSKVGKISVSYAEDLYDSFFEKPVVPQYVANWYEEHKDNLNEAVWEYLVNWDDEDWDDFKRWISHPYENGAITTLVSMHQFGYEARKDKKYIVKFNNLRDNASYLKKDLKYQEYYTGGTHVNYSIMLEHTREELEMNGLGWVFDCPGVEVKEVE
ncbi:DUF1642 domain-containing protein [Streptococcus salivarius]